MVKVFMELPSDTHSIAMEHGAFIDAFIDDLPSKHDDFS